MKNYLSKFGFFYESFFLSIILALSCQAHEYNWRDFIRDNVYRQTKLNNASEFSFKIYNTLHNLPKEKKLEAAQLLLVELIDTNCNYYDNAMPKLFDKILELGENPSLNFIIKDKNISYLNYAIESGVTSETLQYLLNKGCSVRSLDGKNSLLLVLKQEIYFQKKFHSTDVKTFQMFIDANANPYYVSHSGESVITLLHDFENSLENERFEEDKISGQEFIKKITQSMQEAESKKKIGHNLVVKCLTQPEFVGDKTFIPLPEPAAMHIAELAYPYRD